jgi:hypothetical protein
VEIRLRLYSCVCIWVKSKRVAVRSSSFLPDYFENVYCTFVMVVSARICCYALPVILSVIMTRANLISRSLQAQSIIDSDLGRVVRFREQAATEFQSNCEFWTNASHGRSWQPVYRSDFTESHVRIGLSHRSILAIQAITEDSKCNTARILGTRIILSRFQPAATVLMTKTWLELPRTRGEP